jgi:hypothetical protein
MTTPTSSPPTMKTRRMTKLLVLEGGGGKTNLGQSGKLFAVVFYVELHTNTILLRTLLQGNTLKCLVEDIECFHPRVRDDDKRSFLDVRF